MKKLINKSYDTSSYTVYHNNIVYNNMFNFGQLFSNMFHSNTTTQHTIPCDVPSAEHAYNMAKKTPLYYEIANNINEEIKQGRFKYWHNNEKSPIPANVIREFERKGYRVHELSIPSPLYIYTFSWDYSFMEDIRMSKNN